MSYQHLWVDGSAIDLPLGKAVCVGRNYAAHAKELGNAVPQTPILFLKPSTAIVPLSPSFTIPNDRGSCHYETEIAVLIGKTISSIDADDVAEAIAGYGLALDLTLRDVQNQLKSQGYPWEVAKAFDGACPLSPFIKPEFVSDIKHTEFSLMVNGEPRQHGFSHDMITPVYELIAYISQIFTLQAGDIVLTGTPEGVAALQRGDKLVLSMVGQVFETKVV